MENLAGVKRANYPIGRELRKAGIEVVKGPRSKSEVPYSFTGKLGPWNLERAWYYWSANSAEGEGLPLEIATALHNQKYHIVGEDQPETYGQVIRVAGHCACPSPDEWACHYDAQGLQLLVDPKGKREKEWASMVKGIPSLEEQSKKYRFVPSLEGVVDKSVIECYHIDTQEGLNEFARVVKSLI